MRKLLTFLTTLTAAVAVIVLFTACEQFLKDPEDFLSYWASEAFIKDHSIGSEARPDGAGVPCVSSSPEVHIMLTVHNPKNFPLVMPTYSEPAGIVEFKELSQQPTEGTHYVLGQTAPGRLKLTYKEAFLQQYEQGSGSLNPTITLKATDGRVFKKTYTFGIKSNTPPPEPKEIVIAKTTGTDSYYVLCLKFEPNEMTRKIGTGTVPVHKDIAKITINDSHYTLLYNDDNSDFKTPAETFPIGSFIGSGEVEKLTSSSPDLPSGAWVLYYKTNIKIGDGNPETPYTVTLHDKGGVTSDEAVKTIAASGKTHTVTFSVEGGEGGTLTATPEGGSENTTGSVLVEHGKNVTFNANPNEGYKVEKWTVDDSLVNGTNTTYTLYNIIAPKTVKVRFKKVWTVTFSVADGKGTLKGSYSDGSLYYSLEAENVGDEKKFENVPDGTQVSFAATPADGWKVKAWTLDGYNVSGEQENYGPDPITADITVTVEFEKVAAIAGTNNFAWKLLKKAVEIADNNAVITINGTIVAERYKDNWGEIVINGKSLTIKRADGAASAVLDASGHSRIFKVENGANLILENLTLKGGKAEGEEDADKCGGAIYAKDANEIKIINCIITGNEAAKNGGGLNVEGTPTTITNCTFTGNTAKNGGGIYIMETSTRRPVVTISGGTIGSTDTDKANKATGNGGGIYVGDWCELRLQDSEDPGAQSVLIIGNQAAKGGGVYAKNVLQVSMKNGTRIAVNNDVYLDSGSWIDVAGTLTAEAPVARITPEDYREFPYVKVLEGNITGGTPQNYTKFAVTPNNSEHWTVDSNGYLTKGKTAVFNNITKDQIKAAIDAASSMIYGENATIDHMALDGRLVLYETKWSGHTNYGIMHVTEVNNSGGGYIKFNYKTFRAYNDSVQQEDAKKVNGGTKFDLDTGNVNVNGSDFSLENTGQKRFKVLDYAKFYILSN
ncbi:InlB B-repeat-containing protein [Treponema denticola]|uniref:Polymorphic outer membrane protein n=1 Tax=Treponema denticola SP33 TaxID=999437 RepID=M2BKR3_TREDN|nr:right-handed parallel beta-helix repeat-containing protein [Treponema denticola]EMB22559.1 polymorphic outer membrane protein [Treponema denticola SP33]EPF35419.1 polymorphic outer membrane protein [Treponema denticola SP32]